MRVHLREYLVTFNQNTFYIFVYLGKSLSLSFFLVPDFSSRFQNNIFLFASLKMVLEVIQSTICICIHVYTLFTTMHGEILVQRSGNPLPIFLKVKILNTRHFLLRKPQISLKRYQQLYFKFPEGENVFKILLKRSGNNFTPRGCPL